MTFKPLLGAVGTCLFMASFASNAAALPLESRLGGLAYYDPNLDITWAANANINGAMNWDEANSWAAGLDIGGVTGWRLPDMDVNNEGTIVNCGFVGETECKDNEMGYLFHVEGISRSLPDPFNNIGIWYWSNTESSLTSAWSFYMDIGNQFTTPKTGNHLAMAVYDGDVSTIPVPAAVWLFGSGLLGLVGVARRKKA